MGTKRFSAQAVRFRHAISGDKRTCGKKSVVPRLNNWAGPFVSGGRDCLQLLTRVEWERWAGGNLCRDSLFESCKHRTHTKSNSAAARERASATMMIVKPPNQTTSIHAMSTFTIVAAQQDADADAPLFNNSLCVCVRAGMKQRPNLSHVPENIIYICLSVCECAPTLLPAII